MAAEPAASAAQPAPAVEAATPVVVVAEGAVAAVAAADVAVAELAAPQPGVPRVASSLDVAPLAPAPLALGRPHQAAEGEGGEWELLKGQLEAWLASGQLQALWAQARSPLTLVAALVALLVVLRVYAGLLTALEGLPLLPGLLELVGLIWLVRHGAPRLIRTSDRQQLVRALQQRWQAFRGNAG